ncbi:unnamed protein product, partial [Effrenium voratum]
ALANFNWRKLGEGSYGCVYAAGGVAVKEVTATREALEEVRLLNLLAKHPGHPNVVLYHGYWLDGARGTICLVTELLRPCPFMPSHVAGVLCGLAHLHARLVVHRDVKEDNILMHAASGNVKLIDFGCAKLLQVGELGRPQRTWSVVGSPSTAAPEVCLRRGHGLPADLWAVGVLAFKAVFGHHPYLPSEGNLQPEQVGACAEAFSCPEEFAFSPLLRKQQEERPSAANAL